MVSLKPFSWKKGLGIMGKRVHGSIRKPVSLNLEQRKSIKRFSLAFVLLALLPLFLLTVFILFMAVKFNYMALSTGLIAMAVLLSIAFFAVPIIAGRLVRALEENFGAKAKKLVAGKGALI